MSTNLNCWLINKRFVQSLNQRFSVSRSAFYLALLVFVCILVSCSEDSTGPQYRTASGIWNLQILDPGGVVVSDYALNAVMEDVDGALSLSFSTVLQDTIPYIEFWVGRRDNANKVQFVVSYENTLTGERITSELFSPVATFNNELTSFRTDGWEVRDEANNVIGIMYFRGLKVGNQ
jgi:hypothetical protein